METYAELRKRQQEESNVFPYGYAFSNSQFKEMMEKWGLKETDTDKILSIGSGGFIRKTDFEAMKEMRLRHRKERRDAMDADATGKGFIYEMFLYELQNHEYCVTLDATDSLEALGITLEEINADKRLLSAFNRACKKAAKYECD